ncbi:MAG: transglycosylase domain-containing protein [Alphaproteobacteria bacterium]|nr:transglycosylase domain-containing protein [Alphaproteobacteria bacterium]
MSPPRHKKKAVAPPARRPKASSKTTRKKKPYKPYRMRMPGAILLILFVMMFGFGGVIGSFCAEEIKTSRLQAHYLSRIAKDITFEMKEGKTPGHYIPAFGPYNQRLGYSGLPAFFKALEKEGYSIAAQMRASPMYDRVIAEGFYPIYRPKTVTGLTIKDRSGHLLYSAQFPAHVFPTFESVPPLLIDTLLFIEDREVLKDGAFSHNPAIEWSRFFYAAFGQGLRYFMPHINFGGGSTLATQIEKFRFSPGGQTRDIFEKIRQIVSASLRVYQDGEDTREARKKIILDYLNSTPLSARQNFGEIHAIGDGLWTWFGHDIATITAALNLPESDPESLRAKATLYRDVLGLILAQRRPSYYLLTDRAALDVLTDQTLDNLLKGGVISPVLRDASRSARFRFLPNPPAMQPVSFLDQKAPNALRAQLLKTLGVANLYALDRLDLTADSTLDQKVQKELIIFLKNMSNPEHVERIGLYGHQLLQPESDISQVRWSVLLYEKGDAGNLLRLQADNIDEPLDMNDGAKLDLGSTAKLRTLVTYLEIIGELHRRYAGLSIEDLKELAHEAPDALTLWATTWLAAYPEASLDDMLEAALDRKYAADPQEVFFTGGGQHVFSNFSKTDNGRIVDLRVALRDSINLVFVRLMRDIVNYTIAQGQQTRQELLSDSDHPARREYLERYADNEGQVFLGRYVKDYNNLDRAQIVERIARRGHRGATARAILFRAVDPTAPFGTFVHYMRDVAGLTLDQEKLRALFNNYPPERYNLSDRAYITGTNPLELWLASYKIANPAATRSAILAVSRPVRIESYAWLFHPKRKGAQDTRIRILLELDAFARIQQRWARLGYPFDRLVPSFATSIGTSADRPGALAEFVGILVNDGMRKPMMKFERLHFAKDTPYETILTPAKETGLRVLDPAVARAARRVMMEVVQSGTARRLYGVYTNEKGQPLVVGGKTGTGDHRYDEYGPGHRLISSRVVNRTATLVFFIGDRFFGTITAHVAGPKAGDYKFTSALSSQMLKSLAPVLQPLIARPGLLEDKDVLLTIEQPATLPQEPPQKPEIKKPPKPTTPPKQTPIRTYDQDLLMDVLPR